MYSMVLMAAMLPAGDTASFGGKKGGCDGGSSCHGAGFLGLKSHSTGCSGSSSNSCHGGGFLGLHKHKSAGCTGTPAPSCSCCGTGDAMVPPPPVVMPKPEAKPEPKPEVKPKSKGD